MKNRVNIGLIGAGTVGCGVYEVIRRNRKLIREQTGADLLITRIADIAPARKRPVKIPRSLFTTDFREITGDPEIDIVVELIGGTTAAAEVALSAAENGKHLVTANKALLAHRGREIFSAAGKNGVQVGFEASVAGGIPLIRSLKEGLCANKILSVQGIMNGTSNYILHRMSSEGMPFAVALADAQKEGYAEADPSFDINGTDSAHKLLILIALAWGGLFKMSDIAVEGISSVAPADISHAGQFGYAIKPLASARVSGGVVEAGVYPALVGAGSQLAAVDGAFNAVRIEGDAVGPVMFYGMGAGMMPTASAVVSDIVMIARGGGGVAKIAANGGGVKPAPRGSVSSGFYARFEAEDTPGTLGKISTALGGRGISIRSVIQKPGASSKKVPVVIMTRPSPESAMKKAVAEIEKKITKTPAVVLRIAEG